MLIGYSHLFAAGFSLCDTFDWYNALNERKLKVSIFVYTLKIFPG